MEFVQIVEYESNRPDDIRALSEQWRESGKADGGPSRVTVVQDRDNPVRFRTIAEFDSYEQAMAYSNRPETGEFAARMRELAIGEPSYLNLDLLTRQTV